MNYAELFKRVLPEIMVALTALVVLGLDLAFLRRQRSCVRRETCTLLACVGCLAAFAWLALHPGSVNLAGGILVIDPLTQWLKQALLVLTVFTSVLLIDSKFTEHVGEFVALLLLATVAMMFLVSSEDLLMIFLALEMTSLCLYIMTAFDKSNPKSAEAALKYFLFGGAAAAVMLFGFSLLYGMAHSTNLREIAAQLDRRPIEPIFYLALAMILAGLGFKVAAVPFHLWAPDAYQGAPAPAAAFIASGSKVAGFFVLAKLLLVGLGGAHGSAAWRAFTPGWMPVLAAMAALSMVLGNLAAIAQRSVRRLLAYSAIAHAGYALTGLLAGNGDGVSSLLFYAVTYGFTIIGAFGVVAVVEAESGDDSFTAFAGLSRRSPVLATCLFIFMLSLAGIPPLAGFFAKFLVFVAAVKSDPKNLGLLWLVILGIAMSAVSLFYYLQVLKQAFVAEPAPGATPLHTSRVMKCALVLLALIVLVAGCVPGILVSALHEACKAAGF